MRYSIWKSHNEPAQLGSFTFSAVRFPLHITLLVLLPSLLALLLPSLVHHQPIWNSSRRQHPRYTTVFGLDETSRFSKTSSDISCIVEANDPTRPVPKFKYKCEPRPIPECLDLLRRVTEANTNTQYNFCLVNYYANGSDSISYHSDDESFLGPNPAIASFTLGARRDFLMKHKPPVPSQSGAKSNGPDGETASIKLCLGCGDMVLMRGETQKHWLHSIPKRKGPEADRGRINITLRRAMVPAGTENYYRYNVGDGGVYKWDEKRREMVLWK